MPEKSITQSISWSFVMRWSLRLIGLANIAVMARFLGPEDYGIVAMAVLASGFLTLFVEFGASLVVIRSTKTDETLLNTAWTAKIIEGTVLAAGLVATTPLIVKYFDNPLVADIIWFYALAAIINGFSNIGIVLFRKDFDFVSDFKFSVFTKLGSVIITIGLAYWLRNYWAIVYGHVATAIITLVLSFTMHPYRPRMSFTGIKQFLLVAKSLISINVARYASQNITLIVGGRTLTTETLGFLNMAGNFSSIFTQEVILPIARAMFPQYARMKNDLKRLSETYLKVLSAIAIFIFPIGAGLSVVAYEAVYIVLGDKWLNAAVLVQWLAIAGIFRSITWVMSNNVLIVTGNEKKASLCAWIQLILLAPAVIYVGVTAGVVEMVQTTALISIITLPVIAYIVARVLNLSTRRVLSVFVKPAVASGTMFFVIYITPIAIDNIMLLLLVKAAIGVLFYSAITMLFWLLSGRPDGLEQKVLDIITTK